MAKARDASLGRKTAEKKVSDQTSNQKLPGAVPTEESVLTKSTTQKPSANARQSLSSDSESEEEEKTHDNSEFKR